MGFAGIKKEEAYKGADSMKRKISIVFLLLGVLVMGLVGCAPGDPLPESLYTKDVYPGTNTTYDLGSPELQYENIYTGDLFVDGTPVAGGISPTIFDAEGDLLTAIANDTPVILSVGADNFILAADSAVPGGLKWVAAPPPGAHNLGGASHNADTLANLNNKVNDATLDKDTDSRPPDNHAANHTDGTDDIQDANAGQKGLMTVAYAGKLDGVEANATADQTGAEIKTAYEGEADTNAFTDADHNKLDGIEALADKTDAANVNTAGAVMEVDFNASGDLLTATADDTPAILTVGADGTVLTADSGQAEGIKWAVAGGGGLAYTELDGTDTTTAAGQGGGDGAWVDWDLTGIVSSPTVVVEIYIKKLVASDTCGARENGTALVRDFDLLKLQGFTILVVCDAGEVIEIMSDDVSDADVFAVMGYWD